MKNLLRIKFRASLLSGRARAPFPHHVTSQASRNARMRPEASRRRQRQKDDGFGGAAAGGQAQAPEAANQSRISAAFSADRVQMETSERVKMLEKNDGARVA